jgi:phosphate transport system protein
LAENVKGEVMLRGSFTAYIKELEAEVTAMGQMVISSLNRSIEALKTRNIEEAKKVVADDALINDKRWHIEEKCINLIARQQPVATDLREMIAMLSIITDLERMGDHAEGIAKIVIMVGNEPLVKPLTDIPKMAEIAAGMLQKSLDAFIKRDAQAARAICVDDDKVDKLHEQVYHDLLKYMIEDPTTITRATYLIWASHNIERIADRVTNICERIVYLSGGKMTEIKVSSY